MTEKCEFTENCEFTEKCELTEKCDIMEKYKLTENCEFAKKCVTSAVLSSKISSSSRVEYYSIAENATRVFSSRVFFLKVEFESSRVLLE